MRSLFLLLFVFVSYGYADAQNFVSTTEKNKNVVLEEFTGIYCGFCPQGHKIASDYKAANPNDVVVVNIHHGGYAAPSGGDPDFRTSFGGAIDGQANVQGYPAGTVNRRNFPGYEQTNSQGNPVSGITAMGRSNWVSRGNVVLAEASPVNVAAQANLNLQSRELEVIVETYFTAAGGTAPYKLNVALLQNGIEGPQSGSSGNSGSVLPNGNYLHGHMLRHFLTGQWGADITSTTSGYFQADTFRYTIPAAIGNGGAPAIPADLFNMEVAVYVAEGQQTIITGNMASMNLVTPPGVFTASTKLTSSATSGSSFCDYNYIPSVVVENNSTSNADIDSFMVSYSINGGTAVDQLVTTTLVGGTSTTVTFPSATLSTGISTIDYSIDFDSYNNNTLIDISTESEVNIQDGPYTKLLAPAASLPFAYGFQTLYPSTVAIHNPDDKLVYPVSSSKAGFGGSGSIGGFGNSNYSFAFDFWATAFNSGSASLLFGTFDMSDLTKDYTLEFNHAYAQYNTSNDQLQVLVSTDCGVTWDAPVWDQSGSVLATTAPFTNGQQRFVPTSTQWDSNSVDLTAAYKGESSVTIAFKGFSDYGNPAYIDDINILAAAPVTTGIKATKTAIAAVNIMPTPVHNEMTVEFNLPESAEVNMTIYNTLGQQVQNVTTGTFEGTNTVQVNTSKLASGIYLLNLASDKGLVTKRFTVEK
ncbi:MAG: Omp28-related outer membrane protein [Aureispira sp.]|nr:Omp28-related outer membrane protein [Aureispira sp.]